jgi:hypothetical protein
MVPRTNSRAVNREKGKHHIESISNLYIIYVTLGKALTHLFVDLKPTQYNKNIGQQRILMLT